MHEAMQPGTMGAEAGDTVTVQDSAPAMSITNGKFLTLETLAEVCATRRRNGERIVLCHGVFDLVHVGHVRHLTSAKRFGDVLVVTITADRYVNKGPDRPAFPAELRAEFLASLEFVDYVGVVDEPSAAAAIRAARPNYYAKGAEYSDMAGDITGKIQYERELVENEGGELVFTDGIVFSSSNLLNRHFGNQENASRTYLEQQRSAGLDRRINVLFGQIANKRILIVGETIIDRYTYVSPMGKAAKENIIATLYRSEEVFAGGAIAAANHAAAICPNVELLTVLGDPEQGENYESLVRDHLDPSVKMSVLYRPDGPTVQKTRFVEPTYMRKLFEVYHMDDRPLPKAVQDDFHQRLRARLGRHDAVIVADFGHGLITSDTVLILQQEAPFLAVNVQSNAGNIGYNLVSKYSAADFVCVDAMEAWLAVRDKHARLDDVVARLLPRLVTSQHIIVTHGKAGCYASNGTNEPVHIPAFGNSAVDTVGAGDAFFAIAAAMLAAGADCPTAGFMGNVAGATSIGIVGHRRYLSKLELQRYAATLLR